MAEQDFLIGHTQLTAQKRTALRVAGGKPRRVDAVGTTVNGCLPKSICPAFSLHAKRSVRPMLKKLLIK